MRRSASRHPATSPAPTSAISICTKRSAFPMAAGGRAWARSASRRTSCHFSPGHVVGLALRPRQEPRASRRGVRRAQGSASILLISWMYIRMMGPDGLTEATKVAILNRQLRCQAAWRNFSQSSTAAANAGLVAHECIVDLRGWKKTRPRGRGRRRKRLME